MAGVDAGVLVTCSGCGNTVLQKSMVPVLVGPTPADPAAPPPMGYLCLPCARKLIALPTAEAVAAT